MLHLSKTSLQGIVIGSCVVVLVGSWALHLYKAHVEETAAQLSRELPIRPLVNGVMLDLTGRPDVVAQTAANRVGGVKREIVLLVFADSCGICQNLLPSWMRFVEEVGEGREIWLVSGDGTTLTTAFTRLLDELAYPYRAFAVVDRTRFGWITGMRATPTTLMLDRGRRIRMVAPASSALGLDAILQEVRAAQKAEAVRDQAASVSIEATLVVAPAE